MRVPDSFRARRATRIALVVFLAAALAPASVRRSAAQSSDPAPSPQELRQLVERMIASTHRDDAALNEYQRVEHWIERRHENDPQVLLDKVYRVVPTGTGTLKLLLKENGQQVSPETYRGELEQLRFALEWVERPIDAGQKLRIEKGKKRVADRFQAVEAFRDAYSLRWLGTETRDGRALIKLQFDPKPEYHPESIGTELLSSSRVTVWLDHDGQVVRLEAELLHDIAFGGGLLGKIYKGGRVTIDQFEAAPGLWMPRTTRYQVKGRKFLFSAEEWRVGEAGDYRRVGPPREALELVRQELAKLNPQGVAGRTVIPLS